MQIDPALRALRSDPAPQRAAQSALERAKLDWAGEGTTREIMAELAQYGAGEALSAIPRLAGLLASPAQADWLVSGVIDTFLPVLRQHHSGLVPFRHQLTDRHIVIELARVGRGALSVMVYRPSTMPAATTASFAAGERHELCLRGEGRGRLIARADCSSRAPELQSDAITFDRGWHAAFDNLRQTKLVDQITRPLVILRLSRDPQTPVPLREFRLDDGALVHEAAADRRDSRRELALALMGSMGRVDALPAVLSAARSGPPHVRWEAVRQALMLHSGAGFALLCELAEEQQGELSKPAAALKRQLLAAYPALAQVREPCPA